MDEEFFLPTLYKEHKFGPPRLLGSPPLWRQSGTKRTWLGFGLLPKHRYVPL